MDEALPATCLVMRISSLESSFPKSTPVDGTASMQTSGLLNARPLLAIYPKPSLTSMVCALHDRHPDIIWFKRNPLLTTRKSSVQLYSLPDFRLAKVKGHGASRF